MVIAGKVLKKAMKDRNLTYEGGKALNVLPIKDKSVLRTNGPYNEAMGRSLAEGHLNLALGRWYPAMQKEKQTVVGFSVT